MKGFTLIEILVALLILSFIIGAIFAILNVANLSWNSSMGSLDLQQEVRQAMDGMIREIRQSKPTAITVDPSGAKVDFSIPNISNAISYSLSANKIIRVYPAGSGTFWTLANNISSLNFCCLGGANCTDCANSQILQIQMQAAKTVRNQSLSFPLQEKVKFRNE